MGLDDRKPSGCEHVVQHCRIPNAQGTPTYYSTVGFVQDVYYIAYDGSGNVTLPFKEDHGLASERQFQGNEV